MRDKVLEFIHRRFPVDCRWTSGNCYYFAMILKSRFPQGAIYYDTVQGHFIVYIGGLYYDYRGVYRVSEADSAHLIDWGSFSEYDKHQYQRIVKDCIL